MKKVLFLFLTILTISQSCNKSAQVSTSEERTTTDFVTEISYTVTRTATGETNVVEGAEEINVGFHDTPYPVINNGNERDISFHLYHTTPAGVDVISRLSFEFIFSLPNSLFANEPFGDPLEFVDIENYPLLLTDNDDENGRRVCMTKEDSSGEQILIYNACAAEGWYGDEGDFNFEFTYHELTTLDNGEPAIYAEGVFSAETTFISGTEDDTFKLSNGSFKLVIPFGI